MFVISSLSLALSGVHVSTYMYLPGSLLHLSFRCGPKPPRSPCGENQVLRYSTVRYLLHETLHYVSSFLLLAYRYLPLDVQVMSSTSLLGR